MKLLNGTFKTKKFPRPRSYASYLREYKKKHPSKSVEEVKERMEKDIQLNKSMGVVDLRW